MAQQQHWSVVLSKAPGESIEWEPVARRESVAALREEVEGALAAASVHEHRLDEIVDLLREVVEEQGRQKEVLDVGLATLGIEIRTLEDRCTTIRAMLRRIEASTLDLPQRPPKGQPHYWLRSTDKGTVVEGAGPATRVTWDADGKMYLDMEP